MNCDVIAPFYELTEKLVYGGKLQKHRVAFLEAAAGKQTALVLGDGDGRFTEALAKRYPELQIDWVEISAGMIAQARKRLPNTIKIRQADAFEFPLTKTYEIVYTHFFLDCFEASKVVELVNRLSPAMTPGALWIISEFRESNTLSAKLLIRVMYLFFGVATGLKTTRLPEYEPMFRAQGFRKCKEQVSMGGFIASEWWQR